MSERKNQELQYALVKEERSRQELSEQQARIQQQQDTIAQMRNLPFEEPDRVRINKWVDSRLKDLSKHIAENYPQSPEQFYQAEGEMWLKNTLSDLTSSDLYSMGRRNTEYVAMAREAMKKSEDLVGTFDQNGNYISAESQLLNYMNGKSPTYEFKGSYKPDTKAIYDYFGKMDNPNGSKFDRNAYVPDQEVQNMAISTMGGAKGMDMYHKYLRGRQVPYKRYSLEDQKLFNTDIANKNSMMQSRSANTAIARERLQLARDKQNKTDDIPLTTAFKKIIGNPLGATTFEPFKGDANQRIDALGGTPVSDLMVPGPNGAVGLQFNKYSGLTIGNDVAKSSGITKGAQLNQVIVPGANGGLANFGTIKHTIVKRDPNVYIDQPEAVRSTNGDVMPKRAFSKVTIRIDQQTAEQNSLFDDDGWGWSKKNEQLGVGKAARIVTRKTDGKEFKDLEMDVYVPLSGFFENTDAQIRANKTFYGQKESNEIQESSFSTPYDNFDE